MMSFDVLFPELAATECRNLRPLDNPALPDGTFVFREFFCTERDCDCRRTMLQVLWAERLQVMATISYSFEPPLPPFDDEPQTFLDPLNEQSELAVTLLGLFVTMVEQDPAYHDRLVRHYEKWKAVVDDASHPDHHKVRGGTHDDPSHRPAFPRRQEPARREGPKVGPNDPCPCGSGKKHKKCCRA